MLVIDYTGFTKGSPTEANVLEDTKTAWQYLVKSYPKYKKYLYGHSLGTALVSRLAMEVDQIDGLVISAPLYSILEVMLDFPLTKLILLPLRFLPNWRSVI